MGGNQTNPSEENNTEISAENSVAVPAHPFLAKAAQIVHSRPTPVLRSAPVAMHVVSPMIDFMHKITALFTALVLVFGGYAFFDRHYAQFAYQTLQSSAGQAATAALWFAHSIDGVLDITP